MNGARSADGVHLSRPNTGNAPSDGTQLASAFIKKAWSSPNVRRLTLLWLIGLFCMLIAPAPVTVTNEMKTKYESMVIDAAHIDGYDEAFMDTINADNEVAKAKVWFWRFRPEHREEVYLRQAEADAAHEKLDALENAREDKMREAKAYVGLWSEYGVDEARSRFWSAFEAGLTTSNFICV
jgi:hypothetical protein